MDGVPLDVHTVPANTTTSVIKRLKPSTKYRVVVYGVDNNGQPYMSSQSILTTSKGMGYLGKLQTLSLRQVHSRHCHT